MTSSFGIEPQRQVRDLVSLPSAPQEPAAPARPAEEPQRVGGQLLYGRSYQEDNRAKETIGQIADFLKDQGVFDRAVDMMRKDYIDNRKRQAEKLLEQEAAAYKDASENKLETLSLKQAGRPDLARENQLRNPYVNFFYYNTKATDAGKQIAVELADWVKKSAPTLSQVENPAERSAIITQKALELKKPYADLPSAHVAAKIDPLIASIKSDANKLIAKEQLERRAETQIRETQEGFSNELKLRATVAKADPGSPKSMTFGADAGRAAYLKGRSIYVDKYGYDESQYHQLLFDILPTLFIDQFGGPDGRNDLADQLTYSSFIDGLKGIKNRENIEILDLIKRGDKNRKSLRRTILEGVVTEQKLYDNLQKGEINRIAEEKRSWKIDQRKSIREWKANNPFPSQQQVLDERNRRILEAVQNPGLLPEDMSEESVVDYFNNELPDIKLKLGDDKKLAFRSQAQSLINSGVTQMPAEMKEELTGYDAYYEISKLFNDANISQNSPDVSNQAENVLKTLTTRLKDHILSQPYALSLEKLPDGPDKTKKRELLNNAIERAQSQFAFELGPQVKARLGSAGQLTPEVVEGITTTIQTEQFNRPIYSKVEDHYFDKVSGRPTPVPPLGAESWSASSGWNIKFNEVDNGRAWSQLSKGYFYNNPKQAREWLSENFVLSSTSIGEIYKALTTGDVSSISDATRLRMQNVMFAFGNTGLTPEGIAQQQIVRFLTKDDNNNVVRALPRDVGQKMNDNLEKVADRLAVPVAGTGVAPRDLLLYMSNNGSHSHSGNNAIDFFIERGNRYQTANRMPSPVSGRVVFSEYVDGFGMTVVIQATTNGKGYKKGDRILLGHADQLLVQEDAFVSKGDPIAVAGNRLNPSKNTGRGTPGHLHLQLMRQPKDGWSGRWVNQMQYQADQQEQYDFFIDNVKPMFSRYEKGP